MFPDAVVYGWREGKIGHGRRILEGYLSILSAGSKLGDGGGAHCLATTYFQTDILKQT
jgi:hypothetical protein